jgi:hypothetical protein
MVGLIDLHERWRCRRGEQLIRKFAFILTDLQIKQIATEVPLFTRATR